jgi:hypothetical protein
MTLESSYHCPMAGIAARVKQWPLTGRKAQNKREQALILKTDARSILDFAGPIESATLSATLSSARDGKAVPYPTITCFPYITIIRGDRGLPIAFIASKIVKEH